ncbi:MAG TPA: response regulator transcription factor [Methylomirabilota bacterium]|nr:response regulator transcription factor [Methylomirabilota bacterium]
MNASNHVFIVDDSPVVRERLAHLISDLPDTEIIGQSDIAFEAINSIRRTKPSVVVLDISMPGGSGIYVLESIKRERPAPTVIMLTNFAHDQYRQKCFQMGADYFFDKSTEFEKVIDVLRQRSANSRPSAPPASQP